MNKKSFEAFEKKIYLSSPTRHIEMKNYINEAYDTNWLSTVGENINELEKEMAKKTGVKYAVALASGTASLHLAIKLSGVKAGDKVMTSDMTFAATVNPVIYEGAKPVFIDAEYDTWNMDPMALREAFKKHPDAKAVVSAHLYGTPGNIDELLKVCKENNAVLIEDAAESLGATYKGKQTGSFGLVNCISFNGNKIITGSSGGMLLTDDENIANEARKFSTQSRESAWWYQHTQVGYNYRMSNIIAGAVRGQVPYLEEHIRQKKAIYMRYKEAFKDLPVKMNPYDENVCEPNFWLSCMTINEEALSKETRTDTEYSYEKEAGKTSPMEILDVLLKHNAEGRPIWKPMHMQPFFKEYDYISANENAGEDIFRRGLCLPSDNKMTIEEQDRIIEMVRSCFE